jgi:replication initiation protein RepC
MQTHPLTTPFGRRPASLGQVAAQIAVRDAVRDAGAPGSNAPSAVNKWQLFRTLTEIRGRLGLSDRSLALLNALLSFHSETALVLPGPDEAAGEGAYGPCGLVVFPSNRQLSLRAHGMAEKTLRNHLAALVSAGLIARRDSPNGKRYARKADGEGDRPADAFGFDLTPLVARAAAFEAMAEEERRDRRRLHLLKERISLFRRDAAKLIALGLEQDAAGPWEALRRRYMALLTPVRRLREPSDLAALEAALAALRDEASSALENLMIVARDTGIDGSADRHQSSSKTERHHDLEPAAEKAGDGTAAGPNPDVALETKAAAGLEQETTGADPVPLPLGLVLEACPDVTDYAEGGQVRSWRSFLDAAAVIRPMIGISPDAWRSAREALGEVGAHVAVAAILQRSIHSSEASVARGEGGGDRVTVNGSPAIQSPGGYLRSLVEEARRGTFSVGPMLMALIGQRLKARRASG